MKKANFNTFQEDNELILKQLQRNYLQVVCTLGYGTFGRVKLVKFKGKSDVYALKVMRKQQIIQQSQIQHLLSQKQVLVEVKHPNIVSLKSTFQDLKHIYMLFEYIQGGQLFSRLTKNGRFSNDVAIFYVSGILDAISYLHSKNVIFRDLKPENIMIDSQGYPKLIDLGFAKKLPDNTRTFTVCGTPEYLAPQMLDKNNKHGYGKAIDYWGIGVLIFQLLAGYPPFYDNDQPNNIYKKIIKGVIEFPSFFSLRARHIILELLNPNPEERLGVKDNGQEIKQHSWFKKVDWKNLRNCKIPWKPSIKDHFDASNFEEVSASRGTTMSIPDIDQSLFKDFDEERSMQCPTHVKKLDLITSPQQQRCELCNRPATHYCKQCSFIQCSQCRVCSQRHFLVKIIDLNKVKPEYYNNSYACNSCSKSKTVDDDGIWHCNQCNYDLCPDCVE